MCDSDKTMFSFSTWFVGRNGVLRRFVWAAFGTECIPPNSDYLEVAWKGAGLYPGIIMEWIHETFGSKALGCIT